MSRGPAAVLLGALAAAALWGCEDWEQLACGVRHVCAGDAGGPFQLRGGLDDPDPGALLGFAVGDSSRAVLTSRSLWLLGEDGGARAFGTAPTSAWAALAALGVPTRYVVAESNGKVASWVEPWGYEHLDWTVTPGFSFVPLAAVAYQDPAGVPAAALFGTGTGTTSASGVLADAGTTGTDTQACALVEPQGGLVAGSSTSLLVGVSPECSALGFTGRRYVLTAWPRDAANPPPLALSTEEAPSRVRLGSNGEVATLAYELKGGVAVARVAADGGLENNLLSVVYSSDGGVTTTRTLLDAVLQLGDPDRFVYALTNRNPGPLGVTPDEPQAATVTVPPGATLLVFGSWPDRNSSRVLQTQLLAPSRPFAAVRFGLDPHQAEAWLVAACPPSSDGGALDTYCPSSGAHLAFFGWTP